jgi:methionyl-tRNA synthetase
MERFYVTTPIYYVNAEPHLGHAYTTIVADVMNRFHKLAGYRTFFLTGTDEHGDKIAQAAQEAGVEPKAYADKISRLFRETWPQLNVENDKFIRTTDPEHVRVVQYILQKVFEAGDIYFSSYKGLYCVGCERFYMERELVDGKCPDHDKPPVQREEANYFFRMSKYQEWLIGTIGADPGLIRPERYRNEVLAFLKEPLEDLCISRPAERLSWGIPLPFDSRYVTYVWFDALINYVSALGYPDGELYREFWPAAQHVIAKDILKPHGIYWPTMIKAAGLPLYRHLNVHGYWNTDEGKMSKSRGTVVRPLDLVPIYGLDAFRYFVLREMVFGLDSSFSEDALVQRINADLANDLGNLFSRTLAMTDRYFGGKVPPFGAEPDAMDSELLGKVNDAVKALREEMERLGFHKALVAIWEAIGSANRYIDYVGPWNLAKDPALRGRLETVIRTLLEANRVIAVLISPFMPATSEKMLERLGIAKKAADLRLDEDARWGTLAEGAEVSKGEALFPRIETKPDLAGKPARAPGKPEKGVKAKGAETKKPNKKATPPPGPIDFETFQRLDLRVGQIKEAERVPQSEKLLRLIVDIGEERQVVAGIAKTHAPEDLVGKQVIVVANLNPVKLMGIESRGMVLAVRDGDTLQLITPEERVTPGGRVS